jgi:hypothetical protein
MKRRGRGRPLPYNMPKPNILMMELSVVEIQQAEKNDLQEILDLQSLSK